MKTSGAHGGIAARSLTVGPMRQRIAPDTLNSFYVVAANGRRTAFAHHFIRNSGGTDVTDTGAPYAPWRYVGTAELATFDSAPTDPARFVYSDDIGAQDYAHAFTGNGLFGGSYHGGETLLSEAVRIDGVAVDPTVEAAGSQVTVAHSSTVTSGGNSYTLDFAVTVRSADGSLAFHMPALSSAASFTRVFNGMVIGSGAYDEARFRLLDGGSDIAVPILPGSTMLGNARNVTLRNSSNGRSIRVVSNIPTQAGFRRTRILRLASPNRSKLYFEGNGGLLGTKVNLVWTVYFDIGPAGATGFATNLLSNGTFGSDLTGWTATHNPGGVAWAAPGAMRFTRSVSAEGRAIQSVTTQIGAVYLLSATETTTPGTSQGAGAIGLTNASNGSTSTPVPALAPAVPNEAGYNAHVAIANQTTHYVMALQALGTAGQTSDFDGFSLIKLADAP